MDVKEGDVLAGKYRVERVLGQGGMGVVVAAMHLQLEQRVALKFLLPEALQHPEQLTRFSREARAAAKMRNEHVARVIDVGTLETGVPYIVMEYLDGSDLSDYLEKRGPLAIAHAAELTLEACEGLAEAHALGIVHRDLKPANLFLARSPDGTSCLKIVDFGISKILTPGAAEFDMTRTGTIMGSPYYMSPEQMRSSRAVDARADIWSLGVILYELISGHVPFDAPTLPQLCGMILTEPTPLLADARRDTPPRFAAIVSRCLEKEPSRRFQNVGELATALAEFAPAGAARSVERILRLSGAAVASREQAVEGGQPQDRPIRTDWGRTSTKANRSRGIAGALVALVVVAGAGSWIFVHGTAAWSADLGAASHSANAAANGTAVPTVERLTPVAEPAVLEPARSAGASAAVASAAVPSEAVASATARSTATAAAAAPAHPPGHASAGPKHPPAGPATAVPTAPTTSPKGPSPLDGRL